MENCGHLQHGQKHGDMTQMQNCSNLFMDKIVVTCNMEKSVVIYHTLVICSWTNVQSLATQAKRQKCLYTN